jgi:hypothetical protein
MKGGIQFTSVCPPCVPLGPRTTSLDVVTVLDSRNNDDTPFTKQSCGYCLSPTKEEESEVNSRLAPSGSAANALMPIEHRCRIRLKP